MSVYMDVGKVRGGGEELRALAAEARRASEQVKEPSENAVWRNDGFATGIAGIAWRSALDKVAEGVERRVDWQGEQVTTSADDMNSCDREVEGRFRSIERELPAKRWQV